MKERQWGYIDRTGSVVIPFQFDEAQNFSDGLALVSKGDFKYFIKRDGTRAIPGTFARAASFSEGLAAVRINISDKVGFVNVDGVFVIPPTFEEAFPFSEGLASVKTGGNWIYINKNGITVWPRSK
jgi:hypothetical protein